MSSIMRCLSDVMERPSLRIVLQAATLCFRNGACCEKQRVSTGLPGKESSERVSAVTHRHVCQLLRCGQFDTAVNFGSNSLRRHQYCKGYGSTFRLNIAMIYDSTSHVAMFGRYWFPFAAEVNNVMRRIDALLRPVLAPTDSAASESLIFSQQRVLRRRTREPELTATNRATLSQNQASLPSPPLFQMSPEPVASSNLVDQPVVPWLPPRSCAGHGECCT